jgi:hypothetical protein
MGGSFAAHREMKNGRINIHQFKPIAKWANKLQPVVLQGSLLQNEKCA